MVCKFCRNREKKMQRMCKMKLNKKEIANGLLVGQNDNNRKESAKEGRENGAREKNRNNFSKICFTKIL